MGKNKMQVFIGFVRSMLIKSTSLAKLTFIGDMC